MEQPLISFITICYNGFKDTCELIDSLQSQITSVEFEIIVVDNASVENEAASLKTRYPNIVTIRSKINRGFSGGNNLGIEKAKGKYLFFINNDTYITSDGIQHLIYRIESDPHIGGVSPKIRFSFPPQHIQFAGYTPLSSITLRNNLIGFGQNDDGSYDIPSQTPYLHGAAMLIKREIIEKVGAMPEVFFLYYEEIDWSTKMRANGYSLWYEPKWTVFHKESQSTGQLSKLRTYYLTRNRLLYAWRNLTGFKRWLSITYQMTIPVCRSCFLYTIKRRFDLISATFAGISDFIILPNKML